MKKIALICLIVMSSVLAACEDDVSRRVVDTEFNIEASAQDIIDLQMASAQERGVNLLIVFGAAWCHDSRGLEDLLHTDDRISTILTQAYNVAYVDMGQHDTNLDQLARFGVDVLYGTPIVMIIDPETQTVLNRESVHDWRLAYNAAPSDVYAYLLKYADPHQERVYEAFQDGIPYVSMPTLLTQWPAYNEALVELGLDPSLTEAQLQAGEAYIESSGRAHVRAAMGKYAKDQNEAITTAPNTPIHRASLDRNADVLPYLLDYDVNLAPPSRIYD